MFNPSLRRLAQFCFAPLLAATIAALPAPARAQGQQPVVFAAASLKTALDSIAADWKKETGKSVVISYAASSTLARQVEQGAPADVFISADLEWMDWMAGRKLIKPDTRQTLLGNTLVLVAPADANAKVDLAQGFDLGGLLGANRLAVGEVKSVPAGKYGKEALQKLGMWAGVETKLAQTDSVRAALALVARGEAAFGIVYATDAKAEPKVKVVGTFPSSSHTPILYPVALTATSANADAAALVAYLRSPAATGRFTAEGFSIVPR